MLFLSEMAGPVDVNAAELFVAAIVRKNQTSQHVKQRLVLDRDILSRDVVLLDCLVGSCPTHQQPWRRIGLSTFGASYVLSTFSSF